MNFLVSLIFLVSVVHSFAPVQFGQVFRDEQFLKNQEQDVPEGSGENIDEVLVAENSTSTSSNIPVTTPTFTTSSTSTPHPTTPAQPINCYDISKRCSKIKPLCTRDEYKNIMMRQCARTCGLCPQFVRLPQTSRCRDSFHSCPLWARNGFCHSTYYTLEERKDFCRKSCQAC